MNVTIRNGFIAVALMIFILLPQNEVESSMEGDVIGTWADKFGDELWDLAQKMTKANEIKTKYKSLNARVEKKDGDALIESIVESIGRMLNRKMDAVKCIVNRSEEYSQDFHRNEMLDDNFTYYSSKYSVVNDVNLTKLYLPDSIEKMLENYPEMYRKMYFEEDTHFFNLSINTSYSSVHVPTNVYDRGAEASEFIQWSEILDDVFKQNYQSDPALSWQYFGSNVGVMRHFPAMEWTRNKTNPDTYDCRKRSWYIETATCSKDVVILLDNSGSMTGYRNYIAQLTIKSLLDTFSNSDFVNIYNYSNTVQEIVPCFKDMLVQATPENIKVFNNAVKNLHPDGNADVKIAMTEAFKLLAKYRDFRNCNESVTGCNQAIMLVTDGVAGNATDVFEKYNWFPNDTTATQSPVRVFTYLLGAEVTKVREIQLYACLNRGYYSHVQSLDEVAEEVLKYVNVIAAPLVLQKKDHPPTWTHAFPDTTHKTDNNAGNDEEDNPRMMIAVGVPAYNQSAWDEDGNLTGRPTLLGVAGTDVPLEDLNKLALPYKLGVNGYAFIVSNNGYVLLHPDLRPSYKGNLRLNYNSIDIMEVEQIDEDLPPREQSELMMQLRANLVFSKTGKMLKVPIRFHYDKRRRVSQTNQDFYFAPLPHTPFSLGLVLPHDYGNTWIKVGDEIKRNQHIGKNISDYFVGENWKVHPEWVYCKYHYLEGHEFKTPEIELIHFLHKLNDPNWKWSQQYEPDLINNLEELNCGRKSLDDDAYYCNKELVQLLVFDAKVTNESYRSWEFESAEEREIIEKYNATLRFVATMSGLTRWQFIFGEVEIETDQEFGDYHTTAIDETWYKSAILQHKIDQQSFVYSVPHESDPKEDGDLKVTASMAIFPRDGGMEAPSCVVGFQFSHELMLERFLEITSKSNCNDCIKTCDSDEQDCFVIDNNGYIVLSENLNDTGKFFGEVEGAVLEAMVDNEIFRNLTVYDLQGVCYEHFLVSSDSRGLFTPLKLFVLALKWMFSEFVIQLNKFSLWADGVPVDDLYGDNSDDYVVGGFDPETDARTKSPNAKKPRKGQNLEEEEYFSRPKVAKYEDRFNACDKKSTLYVLQQELFIQGRGYTSEAPTNCSRPYFVKRIPRSNLLLVVINTMYPTCYRKFSAAPVDISNETFPCNKLSMNYLPRRRLDECYTEHLNEEETAYCGSANDTKFTLSLLLLLLLLPIIRYGFK